MEKTILKFLVLFHGKSSENQLEKPSGKNYIKLFLVLFHGKTVRKSNSNHLNIKLFLYCQK